MLINLIIAAAFFSGDLALAQSGKPEIHFAVSIDGEFVHAEAHADLPVAPAVAWSVLTDYECYPSFISGLRQSKIVSRNANGLVVEQKGSFGFLFFSQDIEVQLQVSEFPTTRVESHALDGDFRLMTGRYALIPLGNAVRVSYSGRLLPNFSLPPVFGTSIVRYVLRRNFSELVDEILRRDAAARASQRAG